MILAPHDFHFLRPLWFLSLIPCAVLLYLLQRDGDSSRRGLEDICDPLLLSHIILENAGVVRIWPLFLLGVCWLTAATALAGPVWEKQAGPVYRLKAGRVLVLDLSPSMAAQDVKPSRFKRARFKIRDILKESREGLTGLVVFSTQAYVVVPLTDDVATIEAMLPALAPDIMPAPGDDAQDALRLAAELLHQSGIRHGEIILLTDGVADMASCLVEIRKLRGRGIRVDVLGVGTSQGAPIRDGNGGFLHNAAGKPLISRLNTTELQEMAHAGGGIYVGLTADDSDIRQVLSETSVHDMTQAGRRNPGHVDQWREQGAWLVIPLVMAALAGFRRGWLLVLFAMLSLSAVQPADAFQWKDLWQTREQQAWDMYTHGNYSEAVKLFENPQRRAAALYQAGKYAEAAKTLKSLHGADSAYNRGNSLARAGKLKDALNAYEQALDKNPHDTDAAFNRDLVKKLLEQKEQQEKQSQEKKRKNSKDDSRKDGSDRNNRQGSDKQSDNSKRQQNPGNKQQDRNTQGKEGKKAAGSRNDQEKKDGMGKTAQEQQRDKENIHNSRNNTEMGQEGQQKEQREQPMPVKKTGDKTGKPGDAVPVPSADKTRQYNKRRTEKEMALEQWLREIPDDPSGLLRRKFLLEYQRHRQGR